MHQVSPPTIFIRRVTCRQTYIVNGVSLNTPMTKWVQTQLKSTKVLCKRDKILERCATFQNWNQ